MHLSARFRRHGTRPRRAAAITSRINGEALMHQIRTTTAAHRAAAATLTLGVLTLLSGACSDASGPTGFSARPVAGASLQGQAGKLPKIAFSAGGFGSMSIYTM